MSHTVTSVELALVRLPLVHEFETSSGRKGHMEHILVTVTDVAGAVGWGECACQSDPYYNEENVETCWLMLRDYLAPALVGVEWETPGEAYETGHRVRGNLFARAGLDIACWDLFSRASGMSLSAALGGTQPRIEAGVSLGIEPTVVQLLEQVRLRVGEGYRRVKLKIAPGWDVEAVAAVRAEFPDLPLQVDGNGGYPPDDASLATLVELDRFGLLMIEQPFRAEELRASARLQQRIQTPVCLDESITSAEMARLAIDLDAARVINVKVSRLGGLGAAVAVHDACRGAGLPAWVGGMHEFGIGRAANVAVASLPAFTLASDISGSDKYYAEDVVTPPIRAEQGWVQVPAGPGLGYETVEEAVRANTVRTERIS